MSDIQTIEKPDDLGSRLDRLTADIETLKASDIVRQLDECITAQAELKALVLRLHKHSAHPDYMYDETSIQRKSCADVNPPAGTGWEINVDRDNEGWERFDFEETTYWRRLKASALNDPICPYELPVVKQQPVSAKELLEMIALHTNPGYMPRLVPGMQRPSFNSKPEYCSWNGIAALNAGTSYYREGILHTRLEADRSRMPSAFGQWPEAMYVGIDLGDIQILVDLEHADVSPQLRCKNKAGVFDTQWWSWGMDINLDRFALQAALDLL